MTLDASQVFSVGTQPEWLQTLLSHATELGLVTTSWRAGDPERTILTIMSYALNRTDAVVSLIAQGGFLDFAATGTVTFTNPDGTTVLAPVSPDPSDPEQNPTGATTYLDVLCEQNYLTFRIRLSNAGGALAILNTSVDTYGPFAAGAYHVSDPFNNAGYSNTESLTIPPSTAIETVSTIANSSGMIKVTTGGAHGMSSGDVVWVDGVVGTTEANGPWYVTVIDSDEFTLDGSTFTNAYVSGGDIYDPTVTTVTSDVAGSAASSLNEDGVADVHTVTQAVTSLVGVDVSNIDVFLGADTESNVDLAARAKLKLQSVSVNGPTGAYEFFALSASTYAPLLSPPRTMGTPVTRVLAFVGPDGKVYVFLANASGSPSADDIETVDLIFQANCVPLGVFTEVAGADEVNADIEADIYLPAAYATDANEAVFQTALQNYVRALKIGGLSDPGLAYTNVMPVQDVIGALYEKARDISITIDNVVLTINGVATNLSLPVSTSSASVAVLSPAVPTVTLHPT